MPAIDRMRDSFICAAPDTVTMSMPKPSARADDVAQAAVTRDEPVELSATHRAETRRAE